MKTKSNVLRLTMAAVFAAVTTVATMIVQIPSPMNGYVNLGDCFVLLSAWALGPVYGTAAAAIGSMLADVLSGYAAYAPATFIIKGLMALAAWGIAKLLTAKVQDSHTSAGSLRRRPNPLAGRLISSLVAEAIMVGGYFIWAALIFGEGLAAAASIPGNLVQAVIAIPASVIVAAALDRTGKME